MKISPPPQTTTTTITTITAITITITITHNLLFFVNTILLSLLNILIVSKQNIRLFISTLW